VDGHVVTDEQEVVRAGAAADLLEAHEHEHHDLDQDRVEIGRPDDLAFPDRMEVSVRKCQDEMRQHSSRNPAHDQPDRERHRPICLDERPGEEHEAGADHERAGPPLRAARRRDQACGDERDTGHDRERGQRRAVAPQRAPLDGSRSQRSASGSRGTDADDDRVCA
jgi:hypothetical protein